MEKKLEKIVLALRQKRREFNELTSEAETLARRFIAEQGRAAGDSESFCELLRLIDADTVSEPLLRKAAAVRIPIPGIASFRRSMSMRSRARSLTGLGAEWRVNNKQVGQRLARECHIPTPQIYRTGCTVASIADQPLESVVVKPEAGAGASGVYLVFSPDRIRDVAGRRWLGSWSAMAIAMKSRIASGSVRRDQWQLEELVLEDRDGGVPGRDLKFYCFYGVVGLVLEVRRNHRVEYCEWDRNRVEILSGKYDNARFPGDGATSSQIKMAERLSAAVPAPFLRLDFLRHHAVKAGMVFGEFTPRPGRFHGFNDESDEKLGELFLAAEARLLDDLIQRKRNFPEFDIVCGGKSAVSRRSNIG